MIHRIGSVELTESEARNIYESGKYIVTYSRIYQVCYSQTQQKYYGLELYRNPGLAGRGRFHVMTAESINHLLGFELLK